MRGFSILGTVVATFISVVFYLVLWFFFGDRKHVDTWLWGAVTYAIGQIVGPISRSFIDPPRDL